MLFCDHLYFWLIFSSFSFLKNFKIYYSNDSSDIYININI